MQINTEENQALSSRFGVTGIPVIYLLRHGKIVDRLPGAQPADALVNWFHQREREK